MRESKKNGLITVVRPEYVYMKVTPNNSIRNNSTDQIAGTIANFHRSLLSCFKKEEEKTFSFFNREFTIGTKYSFKQQGKISYYIYMEKEKIEFYFIIPSIYLSVIEEKLTGVWNGVTITLVDEIPVFSQEAFKYQMVYEKEDGLSLQTNRSSNELLNASLNVVSLMKEGDRAGVLYNFIPTSQESFRHSYNSTLEKVKKGFPTERNKVGWAYIFKMGISFIDSLIRDITEAVAGKNATKQDESALVAIVDRLNGGRDVSESTKKKSSSHVLDTQILILSESEEKTRERNYATSIAQGFDILSGDNKLVKKRLSGNVNFESTRLAGVESIKTGDQEVQNFISLAGRELIEKYPFMDKVETQETQLPKDLQSGTMCIGETTYRGYKQKAYLSDDEQFKRLMLLLIGPTRAGKSNLLANLSIDAIDNNECVIVFDFIMKNELSREVGTCFPSDKWLRIACDDFEKLQGLGYNEVGVSDDPFKQYENAKRQSANTSTLINAVNSDSGDNSRLSPKMERYLGDACLVVYISGGSMKDVFGVLTNHFTRHKYISKIPANQRGNLEDCLISLSELDDVNRDGEVVGTKHQAGIIDRLNALKRNTYMELMLKRGTENNINLVEEMQKNQLITIEMPQAMFTTDEEKDAFTTYWMTKIWLALQVRADKYEQKDIKQVNLVIDEIYQVKHTEQFLKSKLSQVAKFGMKPIISCHYINQLKYMRDELRSANASYMLIQGCDKKNFDELKEELYPFIPEDLQKMKRFQSMNYIKTTDGYSSFITQLPGKVETRVQMRNRKDTEITATPKPVRKGKVVSIVNGEVLIS